MPCRNPDVAARDAVVRSALVEQLEEAIAGSDDGLFRIDQGAVAAEARLDGSSLLRISDPILSAADVAMGYKSSLRSSGPGGT